MTLVAAALGVELLQRPRSCSRAAKTVLRAGVGWKEGLVGRATVKCEDSQAGYTVRSDHPVIVEDAAAETRFVPLPRLLGEDGRQFDERGHSHRRRPLRRPGLSIPGGAGPSPRTKSTSSRRSPTCWGRRSSASGRRTNCAAPIARLLALSNCNQALIRATDESALLQQICQIVVEQAGYRLCWVGYAEQDDAKTVRPVAQAGFEEGYLKTVNITWADTERGRGPTGTCIRTGRPSLVKDIATDPRFAPWRAEAQKRGYASSIGIPLTADSTTLGALTIYCLGAQRLRRRGSQAC